jgi:NitT/TauT family transport system permease protein
MLRWDGLARAPQSLVDGTTRHARSFSLRKLLMKISGLLFVIFVWEIATGVLHLFKPILLPAPDAVLVAGINLATSGDLFVGAGWSLLRVLLGFGLAVIVAVPLGVLMGWSRTASYVVDPVIEVLRPIPPIAWIGLALIWFGLDITSAIFLVFIGAFFPILLNTISGVRNVDKKLIEVACTFGASDFKVLWKVVIPAALPVIYTGLRVGIGIGWMCVVAAEMLNPQHGLGDLIWTASSFAKTDQVFVGMISIGILGLLINLLFQIVGDRVFAWQKGISKGGGE